jgi:putative oxidoreductase
MNRLLPYAAVPLRLAVGGVFLRHGILGLQAGVAETATLLHGIGFPFATVWAVILLVVETLGAGCVVLGVLTRVWAVCLAVIMVVAIALVKIPAGLDFELEAVLLAGALSLVALGDGPVALGVKLKRGA